MPYEKLCEGPECDKEFTATRVVDKFCCRRCNQKAQDKRKKERRLGIYKEVEIRDNPEKERNPLVAERYQYLLTTEEGCRTRRALPIKKWLEAQEHSKEKL